MLIYFRRRWQEPTIDLPTLSVQSLALHSASSSSSSLSFFSFLLLLLPPPPPPPPRLLLLNLPQIPTHLSIQSIKSIHPNTKNAPPLPPPPTQTKQSIYTYIPSKKTTPICPIHRSIHLSILFPAKSLTFCFNHLYSYSYRISSRIVSWREYVRFVVCLWHLILSYNKYLIR